MNILNSSWLVRIIYVISGTLFSISLVNPVQAACRFTTESSIQQELNMTIPLQAPNISIGPDVANGTVVYRQTYVPYFSDSGHIIVACDETFSQVYIDKAYSSTGPLSSWGGAPYAGKTYDTDMPGLSAVISYGGSTTPDGVPYPNQVPACVELSENTHCDIPGQHFGFVLTIIKTGPVLPGSFSGASLPCPKVSMGTLGHAIPVVSACFTGSVNVASQTCSVSSPVVDLGTHDTSEFSGPGSATEWVDAKIQLTNCPAFHGYNRFGGYWSENGSFKPDTQTSANAVWYSIRAVQDIIDDNAGIMDVDRSVGDAAADGIGIQIARGTISFPVITKFRTAIGLTLSTDGRPTFELPFVARYIQTASSVRHLKPGIANGRVTFTINYY